MKPKGALAIAVATLAGIIAYMAAGSGQADEKKYAATGGWGFGHFNPDGKPGVEALLKTCATCHAKASRDFVFTRYAP